MLRIGVMLDSFEVPRWQERILSEIAASDVARLELAVVNAATAPPRERKGKWANRWSDFRRRGLWNRYVAWDYRSYRQEPDAFEKRRNSSRCLMERRIGFVQGVFRKR